MKIEFNDPKNLEEIVDILIKYINGRPDMKDVFTKQHHGFGTGLRNELHLWWQKDWPVKHKIEKPALVKWFNDLNIYHADDMSGTIQAALLAKLNNEEFNLNDHLQIYFNHWKEYGYKDGICNEENRM